MRVCRPRQISVDYEWQYQHKGDTKQAMWIFRSTTYISDDSEAPSNENQYDDACDKYHDNMYYISVTHISSAGFPSPSD